MSRKIRNRRIWETQTGDWRTSRRRGRGQRSTTGEQRWRLESREATMRVAAFKLRLFYTLALQRAPRSLCSVAAYPIRGVVGRNLLE